MSQICYKIKQVCDYVHRVGITSTFTDALDECVRMAFTDVGELKDTNGDYYRVMYNMQEKLIEAYSEYHRGSDRPLPYDLYTKFMSACRGCGFIVHNEILQNKHTETQDVYEQRRSAQPTQHARGDGGGATREAQSMRELLRKLRDLLETYEQSV